jgi:hypothetical protein
MGEHSHASSLEMCVVLREVYRQFGLQAAGPPQRIARRSITLALSDGTPAVGRPLARDRCRSVRTSPSGRGEASGRRLADAVSDPARMPSRRGSTAPRLLQGHRGRVSTSSLC